jgi:FAD/FMN-containing dehydrogenase/Fe-S oxidoreductase
MSNLSGQDLGAATPLAASLQRAITGEVLFDAGSRALYSTDASNYRHVPIGVVRPRTIDDVLATVQICREHDAPILSRGTGTSIAGQTCNTAVVVDFSRHLNRILDIDAAGRSANVEPGVVLDVLRNRAEQDHLTFGPDPATHAWCTLGGMIGNNSCGVHSVMSGKTVENIEALEILTYDGQRMWIGPTADDEIDRLVAGGGRRGEIYGRLRHLRDRYADLIRGRYPQIPRRVSGYNLDELLPERGFNVARAMVGTEGTCATILQARLRLVESPPARTLLVLGYPDMASGGDRVPEILQYGCIGLEGIDDRLVNNSRKKSLNVSGLDRLPTGGGWLLVEFGGQSVDEANDEAHRLMDALSRSPGAPDMRLFENPREAALLWAVRESGLGATARAPGEDEAWEGWEDSAVPPEKVGPYIRDLSALYARYDYVGALYGHLGDGCLHTRINFDLRSKAGVAKFRSFMEDAADLVVRYGGSLSGEHGDGQARAELLPKMYGEELVGAFREFKSIWDPTGKMNPGKVVDPLPLDQNMRIPNYRPLELHTQFQFPEDGRDFSDAVLRCVGVGRCRKIGTGTMCPSYMATGEEMHSTRGRARLLFEMMQSETLTDAWQDEHVKEALDLCLACKACKTECPVQVDMATYKAEFLSHYYEGHRRPLAAYAFGWIGLWARLASPMSWVANLLTHAPLTRDLAKRLIGIAPQRSIPSFASESFKAWFGRRPRSAGAANRSQVVLWPDTFNNYFHPETARAATEVLERAGFEVIVPTADVCCGRPTYDYGMVETGRRLLRHTLEVMKPYLDSGTPIVGLEPSCVSVFRDELPNLFPDDPDAKKLSAQVRLLAEFFDENADALKAFGKGPAPVTALLHGHCHQRAMAGMGAEERVLTTLGIQAHTLDSGCCGMAGAFGFEEGDHYEVSMQLGERVLLPAVREADPDTLIVADGFSCREQIEQGTPRRAMHLAEVMLRALGRRL